MLSDPAAPVATTHRGLGRGIRRPCGHSPEPYHVRDGVTVSHQDRHHLQQEEASAAGLAGPPPSAPRPRQGTLSAGNWTASPAHGVRFWIQLEAVSK